MADIQIENLAPEVRNPGAERFWKKTSKKLEKVRK